MSGVFGGGSEQTSTQKTTLPGYMQGTAKAIGGDLLKTYKKGGFKGSTVVPFNWRTEMGMKDMMQGAKAAQPAMDSSFNVLAQQAGNGGLNELQQGAVDKLQKQANGDLLFANPNVQKMIDMNARDIGASGNLMASAAGRYGSGGHANVIARNVGDMATQVRGDDYNRERGYMQDAIGSIYNAGQQQQQNNIANNQALQSGYAGTLAPGQTMMDVGGQYEDLATRKMQDKLRLHDLPYANMRNALGIATGTGAGSTTTIAQGPSRLQSGLGGALSGYGMTGGPWGALGGAMLGMM